MFQKGVLEPQQRRVEGTTQDSQALVQSAAPGVNTSTLESDLEILNDKWTELNEKVNIWDPKV